VKVELGKKQRLWFFSKKYEGKLGSKIDTTTVPRLEMLVGIS
jgi:hypothetical protein